MASPPPPPPAPSPFPYTRGSYPSPSLPPPPPPLFPILPPEVHFQTFIDALVMLARQGEACRPPPFTHTHTPLPPPSPLSVHPQTPAGRVVMALLRRNVVSSA